MTGFRNGFESPASCDAAVGTALGTAPRTVLDASSLRSQLSVLAADHRVCGAQLAVHHGGGTVAIEVGDLEHGGGRPVTPDAAFAIGSITKAFTATLALVLVADDDLDLDAPLRGQLGELADLGELGERLTLRQLLSHTGGLAGGSDPTGPTTGSLRRYAADQCRPRNFVLPPGAGFSYSNIGYVVAGRLAEVATGMTWPEAVASIVLRPLGIVPAFICPSGLRTPARPMATGHSVNAAMGRIRPVRQSLEAAEGPAGGLAASALDLVALGRIHVPPGMPALLPRAHAELMRRPVPGADPWGLAAGWGLGLAVFGDAATAHTAAAAGERGGTVWVGHDGTADGTSCHLRIDPVGGTIIALTTNTNTGTGLWRDLLVRLADAGLPVSGGDLPPDPAPDPRAGTAAAAPSAFLVDRGQASVTGSSDAPAALPSDCVGTYVNGDTEYVVTGSAHRLALTIDGEEFTVSADADELTFTLLERSTGQRLPGGRFRRDLATGEINGIQVTGRLARRLPGAADPR
jgi:CubicO group peptidase (beta-lactamase class C family)